jgi:hypothetical protein
VSGAFRVGQTVEIIRGLYRPGFGEDLFDITGRRTFKYGLILDPQPLTPTAFTYELWTPQTSLTTLGLIASTYVYKIRVFDLDTRDVVEVDYPQETLLLAPADSLGVASALHYDGDAPTPELAEALIAERIAR